MVEPSDFIKFCENIDYYLSLDMQFIEKAEINYPIGKLGDIKIYFQHYSNNTDALNTWNRRKKRLNMNELFIMFTDRDGCSYDDLIRFDKLSIKNKIVFTHINYKEISSAYYIPGFEKEESVGNLMNFRNKFTWLKYYDAFDYVSWFNKSHS